MIKLFHSPYSLRPLSSLNATTPQKERKGTLLKVRWDDGLLGYADLHPWPELGDEPLEFHIKELEEGRITALVEQSMWLAHRDATLRSKKKNFFEDGKPLKNNFTITQVHKVGPGLVGEIKNEGFSTVKVKVGREFHEEVGFLEHLAAENLFIRLDFNAQGNWQTFEKYISNLSPEVKAFIEYVEDPFPFDERAWKDARTLVPIALDNEYNKVPWHRIINPPFDVMVVKPARVDVNKAVAFCRKWDLKMTITSSMDHPVGVAHALSVAMELKKAHGPMILDAGCMTHHLYQKDLFVNELPTEGPYFTKGRGMGVGFDKILQVLPWHMLRES